MSCEPRYGVIAGDIVGSTELSTELRRRLPEILESSYRALRSAYRDQLPYELAIAAGDEWRIAVDDPHVALAVSLAFATRLKARDITSRVVVAIDTIDFIEDGDLHRSDGAALRRAGRGLKKLERGDRNFDLVVPSTSSEPCALSAASIADLVDLLLDDLTAAQSRAVASMLCGVDDGTYPTATSIAEDWTPEPISRQAVGKHLSRARWPRIKDTLDRFQQLMELLGRHDT